MDNNILLIGSKSFNSRPSSIGGATVLFDQFLNHVNINNVENITVVLLNPFESSIKNFFSLCLKLLSNIHINKIIFINVSQGGLKLLFPIVFFTAKLFNKKIVLRVYGSHAYDVIFQSITKKILLFCFKRTDLVYLETNSLIAKLKPYNNNIRWFPNVRNKYSLNFEKKFNKRFVFIGQIKESKGVLDCINVFNSLDSSYSFRFYGVIDLELEDKQLINYGGVLVPSDVPKILNESDVLVLPTYYEGEGYPGVIIEAYMMGVPVITTKWKSIPEIVDDNQTGILVTPKNMVELKKAILSFTKLNYNSFSNAAKKKFSQFDSDKVHKRILNELGEL